MGDERWQFFKYWDWEDSWALLAIIVAMGAVAIGTVALTADHSVRYYYIGTSRDANPCVKAGRNWAEDTTAFCSDDISKVADALKKFNEELRGKH